MADGQRGGVLVNSQALDQAIKQLKDLMWQICRFDDINVTSM
jgi:hypothetical protein